MSDPAARQPDVPQRRPPRQADFPWYLASSGLWLAAMTLQTFLVQWLLVFHLEVEAMELGVSRALMELPPLAMLLIGGALADRVDGRRLLIALSLVACLPPLAMVAGIGHLTYWPIIAFGIALALLQSLSDPSRAAMLSRVTRIDIQRTVTVTTVVTTLIGMGAFWLGGRLETLGLATVLLIQAALFLGGGLALRPLPALPPSAASPSIRDGLRTLWRLPLVRNVIGINFVSAMFNAGAYIVVMPLVVREVYQGDAAFLSSMFIAFTIGSTGTNVVLLFFMPLLRPGRLFLVMQLTRILILLALWAGPPAWLFFVLVCVWGVNMGATSTLARTTVQELAPTAHRAKILAVLLASFMVASPISALTLGFVVEASNAPAGLLPGILVSVGIFAFGILASGLWLYESPSHAGAGRAGRGGG